MIIKSKTPVRAYTARRTLHRFTVARRSQNADTKNSKSRSDSRTARVEFRHALPRPPSRRAPHHEHTDHTRPPHHRAPLRTRPPQRKRSPQPRLRRSPPRPPPHSPLTHKKKGPAPLGNWPFSPRAPRLLCVRTQSHDQPLRGLSLVQALRQHLVNERPNRRAPGATLRPCLYLDRYQLHRCFHLKRSLREPTKTTTTTTAHTRPTRSPSSPPPARQTAPPARAKSQPAPRPREQPRILHTDRPIGAAQLNRPNACDHQHRPHPPHINIRHSDLHS